ncbi:uncharacterized protein LOC115756645 [Rhodamnia argentea]|uniref:Uncharacterized protein LOC115756645 n=1 Tax=Rhodamnia argentea TaxID=178133 RepID=A0A8B8QYS7_9MYRT|nr:uncharacterized protein LOC115756645 [Rhodamnia argentea]
MRPTKLFLFVILFAIALKSTQAIRPLECEVLDNTTGTPDSRFGREVGTVYGSDMLITATEFVLRTFGQSDTGGRGYDFVLLVVESFYAHDRPYAFATTNGSRILMNADYLQTFPGDMKEEFTGIVYFTSGLVWQWTGNGGAPMGLLTGMADYIRLTAGWGYEGWPRRGSGLRWDEGYAITANFLEYCEGLRQGFVSDLNAMMIDSYSDAYFVEILGKPVNVLWEYYKFEYATPEPAQALEYGSPGPAPAQTFGY